MKALSTSFILFTLILFSYSSYAQEPRYVELEVSDTVALHATKFIYEISFGQQTEFMGMRIPLDEKNSKSASMADVKDLTGKLDSEKFDYSLSSARDYTITDSPLLPSVYVNLDTENELKRLYNLLKDEKGIVGKIKDIVYEPIDKYQQVIYQDLYEKARRQATIIAGMSGNSIGYLNSATNVNNQNQYMDLYEEAFKNMPLPFNTSDKTDVKEKVVKMVFRFAIVG